jgi:phosphoglucosamine mutase
LKKYFGTDGVRGIAGKDLTADLAFEIGKAAGSFFINTKGVGTVTIGKDPRASSGMIEIAVAAGLCSVGMDVNLLGIVPTPLVSFAVLNEGLVGGVMISASHNQYEYNGIKVFDATGMKLCKKQEQKIEEIMANSLNMCVRKPGTVFCNRAVKAGYLAKMKELVDGIEYKKKPLKVAVDCANGSASETANEIFRDFGSLQVIYGEPNGRNINCECGSTNVRNLVEFVKKNNCDIGFAFDGDADRCFAVNRNGKVLDGDNILWIVAKHAACNGELQGSKVVVTKMSNMGLFKAMEAKGINVIKTDVGDKCVLEAMLQNNCNLGAENSGHLIYLDYSKTGDGQLTACLFLKAILELGIDFNELGNEFEKYQQINGNVMLHNKKNVLSDDFFQNEIEKCENELGEFGRIIVRESGTEPVIRILVEGEDGVMAKDILERLVRITEELDEA